MYNESSQLEESKNNNEPSGVAKRPGESEEVYEYRKFLCSGNLPPTVVEERIARFKEKIKNGSTREHN